jgi:hypothetical protein
LWLLSQGILSVVSPRSALAGIRFRFVFRGLANPGRRVAAATSGLCQVSCMKVPCWLSIMGQVRCDVRSTKSSKPQLTTTSNVASYSIFRESTTCTQRGSHETATSLIAFGKSTITLVTTIA